MEIKAYTSPGCFYCDQLKELFKRAEVDYEAIVVGGDYTQEQFKQGFPDATGFPYVIIDGERVGGLVETAKLFLQKGIVSSRKK